MPIVQNDLFEGIMGLSEFKDYQKMLSLKERENIVLISISEPDNTNTVSDTPSFTNGFHDILEIKFWDIEQPVGRFEPLTWEQGIELRDFILKNKEKKFLIHCKAGKSRSAGVGMATECLINYDGNVYNYFTSHSEIREFERYSPNLTVFDRIVKSEMEL